MALELVYGMPEKYAARFLRQGQVGRLDLLDYRFSRARAV